MGNGVTECEWCHAPEARGGFWEFEESERVETRQRTRRLTFACSRRPWAGVARDGGGRLKGRNRNIVSLFPYVEEPLNSKVIKSFVPELRSRYVFFEFRDPYVLCIYKWTLYVHFTHGRIWLRYIYIDVTYNPHRQSPVHHTYTKNERIWSETLATKSRGHENMIINIKSL